MRVIRSPTCPNDVVLRLFALMGRILADNPKHGVIQSTESSPTSSAGCEAPIAGQNRSELTTRWAPLAVLLLTAILYFVRLGARALWASEFRWAEIARWMLLTHNYVWPTINGRVYFDKPLGSYWLVVAATGLTGGLDETSARLPCAIGGLLGVWLVMLVGRRLYDDRT